MNKHEAIKKVEQMGEYERFVDESIPKLSVLNILNQLDEPQKLVVPQLVADWYEENKDDFEGNLFRFINRLPAMYQDGEFSEFEKWVIEAHTKPFQTLVNMHQFGYTVEEEKRYYVRFKWIEDSYSYLTLIKHLNTWTLYSITLNKKFRTEHTKKQLEDAGFGWVFDCPGIEIEEVEE